MFAAAVEEEEKQAEVASTSGSDLQGSSSAQPARKGQSKWVIDENEVRFCVLLLSFFWRGLIYCVLLSYTDFDLCLVSYSGFQMEAIV